MATITGFTAARMLAIEAATIVGGHVDSQGNLILETRDGQHILGGYVQGTPGAPGVPGRDGIDVDPIMLDDILAEIEKSNQTIAKIGTIAKPVENIQMLTNVATFTPDRRVLTKTYFIWDAVLEDITGSLIDISRYEIWLRKGVEPNYTPYITVPDTEVILEGLTPELNYSISIRAQAKGSTEWSALSIPFNFTPINPPRSLAIPTTPLMETGMGLAVPAWDGLFEEDLIATGFQHLLVEQLVDGIWLLHGVPSNVAGKTTPIRGEVGSTVEVRFKWVDVLNRISDPSESASIVIAGVDIGDISEQIEEAMEDVNARLDAALADLLSPVKSIVTEYVKTTDPNNAPSTGWSTEQPTAEPGKYIWTRTVITNIDGGTETSIPALIGTTYTRTVVPPAITSYAVSLDPDNPPEVGWGSSIVLTINSTEYQWVKLITRWSDNTETITYSVNAHGSNWLAPSNLVSLVPYYYVQASNGPKPKRPINDIDPESPWTLTRPGPVSSVDVYRTERLVFNNGKYQFTPVTKLDEDPIAIKATSVANLAEAKAAGLIKASMTDPGHDPGRIWLVLNAQGQMVGIKVSNGSTWASYTLMADQILVPSSVGTVSIAQGAVTASKMTIIDSTNYFQDPSWEDNGFNWGAWLRTPLVGIEKNGTGASHGMAAAGMLTNVKPGSRLKFTATKTMVSGTVLGTTKMIVYRYDANKNLINTIPVLDMLAQGESTNVYTVPTGTHYLDFGFRTENDTPVGTRIRVSNVEVRMMVGTLIEPNSISTPQLKVDEIWGSEAWLDVLRAGVIEASMVTSGFADSLNLQSNNSIVAIIESQVAIASNLSGVESMASYAQEVAGNALNAAGNAAADAQTVQSNLDNTNNVLSNTNSNVETIRLWFRVDSEGAHIGKTGSKFQTHIKPDRFEITENDIVTTYWESGRMVVREAVVDVITLSSHSFEPYLTNGTVIRVAT